MNTFSLGCENMIRIGSVVSEICPVKVKSWGACVYSSRCIYSVKYGMLHWEILGNLPTMTFSSTMNSTNRNQYIQHHPILFFFFLCFKLFKYFRITKIKIKYPVDPSQFKLLDKELCLVNCPQKLGLCLNR